MSSRVVLLSRTCVKTGYETEMYLLPVPWIISTSRSGSEIPGSGRSISPFTTLKIAVLAPMPSASVTIASALNPTWLRRVRAAKRMSCSSVSITSPLPLPALTSAWIRLHSSRIDGRLPNRRSASRRASWCAKPFSSRSSAFISRWLASSSSTSRGTSAAGNLKRRRNPGINLIASGLRGVDDTRDGLRGPPPAGDLRFQMLLAPSREGIELRPPPGVVDAPLR